ncbi:hypothetical protein HYC85_026447 [Camellia sinensis]|uniref:ABC transmembrane type-1 domain-containing protein n=1 Tax=Camellia sinensis TaxID=4442 RepID=A0A7J7G7A3_CAMSI|nr:hypothetical protein HYC85_026447 [Camellia sinensis]
MHVKQQVEEREGRTCRVREAHSARAGMGAACAVVEFSTGFYAHPMDFGAGKDVSMLDMLSFPKAIQLLCCAFCGQKYAEIELSTIIDELYVALQGKEADSGGEINVDDIRTVILEVESITQKGEREILEDKDMPKLRQKDRTETCYFMFVEQISKRKESGMTNPSILSTIFFWQWKAILVSGFFFGIDKGTHTSYRPLLLKAFIEVSQGKERFKYEGYAITVAFFLTKSLESLSERQCYFQTRLIGLQVRYFLSAAIYKKQLRLSNTATTSHSPGEMTNYVTVDAYRIGEFPYWFHQIWTTPLQICLAFLIIYYSMGLATIAAVFIIILAVLGNYPVVKLQQKQLTKLMVAQDRRLKIITETLTNMKVLKLYAWENHFKNAIERLQRDEYNYLSLVLSQRGYAAVLFVSSINIASVVTFWVCYFLKFLLILVMPSHFL